MDNCVPNEFEKTGIANAELIAAAPQLLKIAQAYRNLLRTLAQSDTEVATYEHIQNVLEPIES